MKAATENRLIDQAAAPSVTVLMPVYNGERHLREAISSILAQTFSDFEFVIVDDGSNDSTREILRSFDDPRINVLHLPQNRGVIAALNAGLDRAQGRYVARMDADDVALPHRLARQVEFMEAHPDVGVCGTWFTMQGDTSVVVRHPASHQAIMEGLLHVGCVLGHPTVMIRRQALGSLRYKDIYRHAEDYGLWAEMSRFTRFANVPEVCLLYRSHGEQISVRHARTQGEATERIRAALICSVDAECAPEDVAAVADLAGGSQPLHPAAVASAIRALRRLLRANSSARRFQARRYKGLLAKLWFRACIQRTEGRLRALKHIVFDTPAPLVLPGFPIVFRAAWNAAHRHAGRLRAVVSALWIRPGVVARVSGDLASQMFQYAAARVLAGSCRVPVRVDTSEYAFFKKHAYRLSEFSIRATLASAGESMRLRRRESALRKVMKRMLPGQRRVVEAAWAENPAGEWPRGNLKRSVLVGHWQDPRYFQAWRDVLRSEYRPRAGMSRSHADLAARLAATESVAVYASPAPYIHAACLSETVWPMSASAAFYEQAFAHVRRKYPEAQLFLFRSQAESRETERPGLPVASVVAVSEDNPADLYLISHARHFVIPASLFAWWAAWLGDHPSKEVIAPRSWWRLNPALPNSLALTQWTLLATEP